LLGLQPGHAWATSQEGSRLPTVTQEHSTSVGQQEYFSWLADSGTTGLPSWSCGFDLNRSRACTDGDRLDALGDPSACLHVAYV